MSYIQLEVPEYTGPSHRLAVLAAAIITAVSGVQADEDGRVEGPADLDDTDERIVQVATALVDLAYERLPPGAVGLPEFLRLAAELLDAQERPDQ